MYKISYEKCVCFIFLVVLAILSCSGFRIDNLAMTDIISKKNSNHHHHDTSTSSSSNSLLNSDEFFARVFDIDSSKLIRANVEPAAASAPPLSRHRIRHHHRRPRAHQAHHDTIEPSRRATTQPSGPSAQIPTTDLRPATPTKSIVNVRSQRSNELKRPRNYRRQYPCQEQDITRKAYLANTIVLARAESISSNRHEVLFKVVQRIKNSSFPVDDIVRLKFSSDKGLMNCEQDDPATPSGRTQANLVRARIEPTREYVLFLRAYGAHNYSNVGTPELVRKKKIPNSIYRVSSPSFKPRPAKVEKFERAQNAAESRKRLKLVCKVKGLPIPYIIWKRNGTLLHSNSHVRITYKNDGKDRRKSTLVIKNPKASDWGQYECTARGVDGSTASKGLRVEFERRATSSHTPTSIRPSTSIISEKSPSGEPCNENMKIDYCNNRGTCFYEPSMDEYGCLCADDYSGSRCEVKLSNQSSMYGQNTRYTCNVGLYTKYDNC